RRSAPSRGLDRPGGRRGSAYEKANPGRILAFHMVGYVSSYVGSLWTPLVRTQRRDMSKRSRVFALMLAMVMVLAACGNGSETTTTTSGGGGDTTTTAPSDTTTTEAAPTEEEVELVLAHSYQDDQP